MKKLAILALCFTLVTPATFAKKEVKAPAKTEQKANKKAKAAKVEKGSAPVEKKNDSAEKGCCKTVTLNTLQDSIAYAYGMAMGKQTIGMLEQMKNDVDFCLSKDIIVASMMTQLTKDSANMLFTENQLAEVYSRTNNILREAMQKKQMMEVEKNKLASAEFLAKMEQEPGVIKTESGLLYKVDRLGDGVKPEITSLVQVHYVGKLMDGTEFDSSYKRNQPSSFRCNQVIKGWTEALCKMPVGSKWELYIPYDLAYGDRDTGKIKPYSTLIFAVELLGIEE
jgi:FKBP-type peptidyl-prolyl cis-trans isomerase FklB